MLLSATRIPRISLEGPKAEGKALDRPRRTYPLDLHGIIHILQGGIFRNCMKMCIPSDHILWICVGIRIFYTGVPLEIACKYVDFQWHTVGSCMEVCIFQKGVPFEIV